MTGPGGAQGMENAKPDLAGIAARVRGEGVKLSDAMILGLGAGVYFEYMSRPSSSPTRRISGLNRALEQELELALRRFQKGPPAAIAAALRINALAMDLDRSHYTAIMGMELLAEDFENWLQAPDVKECAARAAAEIETTESLYRGCYVRFLEEASGWYPAAGRLAPALQEISSGWDALALLLRGIAREDAGASFGRASSVLRRLALLEENYWGGILDQTEQLDASI